LLRFQRTIYISLSLLSSMSYKFYSNWVWNAWRTTNSCFLKFIFPFLTSTSQFLQLHNGWILVHMERFELGMQEMNRKRWRLRNPMRQRREPFPREFHIVSITLPSTRLNVYDLFSRGAHMRSWRARIKNDDKR
jgi:hypothetical protein